MHHEYDVTGGSRAVAESVQVLVLVLVLAFDVGIAVQ